MASASGTTSSIANKSRARTTRDGPNARLLLPEPRSPEQDAQFLSSLIELSSEAIISKSLGGVITSWNSGAENLLGYTAEEAVGQHIGLVVPPERCDEEAEILARIAAGFRIEKYETVRQSKSGSKVEVTLSISPIRDDQGTIIGASAIIHDNTAQKRAFEVQELLVAEIKHRVRNTLAMVQAIANQTLTTASPDESKAFGARLLVLAQALDLVSQEAWDRSPVGEIINNALLVFKGLFPGRIDQTGPSDIWLNSADALNIALGLHELATNAVKYGALSNDTGVVQICWERTPHNLRLQWEEKGGPSVSPPERKGFGSLLIDRLFQSKGWSSRIEYHPAGVGCLFEIGIDSISTTQNTSHDADRTAN